MIRPAGCALVHNLQSNAGRGKYTVHPAPTHPGFIVTETATHNVRIYPIIGSMPPNEL